MLCMEWTTMRFQLLKCLLWGLLKEISVIRSLKNHGIKLSWDGVDINF